jgi:DNA-binding response OmpR family regulator
VPFDRSFALVVEDNRDFAEPVADVLRWEGFGHVKTADSAEAALAICEARLPGLILADVGLPTMSGLDLVAELRSRHGERCPPVILLSGEIPFDWQRIPGVVSALRKPCSIQALREAIRRVLMVTPVR